MQNANLSLKKWKIRGKENCPFFANNISIVPRNLLETLSQHYRNITETLGGLYRHSAEPLTIVQNTNTYYSRFAHATISSTNCSTDAVPSFSTRSMGFGVKLTSCVWAMIRCFTLAIFSGVSSPR